MTELRFSVDHLSVERISGWVDQDGPLSSIDILVDKNWIASVAPLQFRRDLKDHGLGDGRRGFDFTLRGYIPDTLSLVELRTGDRTFFKGYLNAGRATIADQGERAEKLLRYSQDRWKGDQSDSGLTWGREMDGASLWDIYSAARRFSVTDHILEIGPGYGRLLKTAIERKVNFASFTGLELSEARVSRLNSQFGSGKIKFITGDVNNWSGERLFDVIICSSTFEHLYPDCSNALNNLASQLAPNGTVFIDFMLANRSTTVFEASGTFVRSYGEEELRALLEEANLSVEALQECVLGEGVDGPVSRSVITARGRAGRAYSGAAV